MRTRMNAFRLLAILALALAAWTMTIVTRATTLERMSLEQLAQSAQIIVRAQCLENSTAWDAGEIWSHTTFEVQEAWKGSAPEQITVRLLGGRAGNVTSTVTGIPRFRRGEQVVLFLEGTSRGGLSVVSWQQGPFRIHRDAFTDRETVTQDTASFPTFDPVTRRFEASGIRKMPLENFRAQVDAALRGGMRRKP